uniref:Uncharacterized protein n=1 Tax=Fagus sylvatica TaxID=28930 RepID=A0A2N9HAA3_FAGSY
MPIQRRTVNIGSVLGTLAPKLSGTSDLPLAPEFSEGEFAMKKRKTREKGVEGAKEQQALVQTEPSGKGKNEQVSHKRKHQKELPLMPLGGLFSSPRICGLGKGITRTQMIENSKRDSVVAVQGIFEVESRLIETERLLNDSLIENDRLREVEKTASARIHGERECNRSSGFQVEIDKLRAELAEAQTAAQNAENAAQAFYDQGFEEATESLRSQLGRECNIHFLKGWPFNLGTPENLEEVIAEGLKASEAVEDPMGPEAVEVLRHQEQVLTEEVRDVEKGVSNKEDNVNVDDKDFTAKKIEFVERRMVKHLLKRPCSIDSDGHPRAASILLEYEPSYKSFQKGPIVKNFGQAEVTVSRPGRSQEEIIQAVPVTARKGVQVGDPVIRFPSLFDPTHQPDEDMPVQRRSIDIGTVLGTSEEDDEDEGGQELPLTEPLKKKSPSKKGKSKSARALQKAAGQVSQQLQHRNDPKEPWSCVFLINGRAVDEGDSVLKNGNVRGRWSKLWEKLDREYTTSALLRVENRELKDAVNEAQAEVQKAEGEAQSYYDQGFDEAASSLKSQLGSECNKFFVQGWRMALDKVGVDDASELYDLASRYRPFEVVAPEERGGEKAAEDSMVREPREVMNEPELVVNPKVAEDPGHFEAVDRIRMVEVQEEKEG